MQKYEIISIIGQGAYGVVLKCKNNQTKQILAIKKFKQTQDDQIVKKITMRQIKILKNMKNNNIVQLRDAFRRKGVVYLVFQYVENNLLQILEKTHDGLEPQTIKYIIYQLIKGLAYMHSNNIVHRDIKPQNLLIGDKKQLKICDFGFARNFKKNGEQYTDYVATRWYRPPELLVGAPYDSAIDIWAVGCIMAELIDGNPLFPGQNQFDQLFLIQKCLGNLTSDHFEIFLKNPRFIGMKFPQINNFQSLEKKYLGKLSQKALNFLKLTLKFNPAQRITAIQALKHSYFDSVRQNEIIQKYTSLNHKTQSRNKNFTNQSNNHNYSTKQDYPNSVSYDRKKIAASNNQPILTSHLERQKTQENITSYAQQNLLNTRNGKFYNNMNNQTNKLLNNKSSQQDIKYFELTSKGFAQNLHSKSMNKNSNGLSINNNKITKYKQKYVSLQKGPNRSHVTQTQAGFYKNKAIKIQINQRQQIQQNIGNSNKMKKNKIHGTQNNHYGNYPGLQRSRNQKNKSIMNTQQIYQQDQSTYSTSQLPFLMIASQQSQIVGQKHRDSHPNAKNASNLNNQTKYNQPMMIKNQKNKVNYNGHIIHNSNLHNHGQNHPQNLNIIISNSVFNYKH